MFSEREGMQAASGSRATFATNVLRSIETLLVFIDF
jgi:hypothetical protein